MASKSPSLHVEAKESRVLRGTGAISLAFEINTSSHEPVSMQISSQIRRAISSGRLAVGDPLPSARAIARELAVNPMTVSKAFQRLADEGILARRRGMTMTVVTSAAAMSAATGVVEAALSAVFAPAIDEALRLQIPTEVIVEVLRKLVDERQAKTSADRERTPNTVDAVFRG